MATVSGSIVLYEQMTAPMQNIIRSMNMVISSMEEVKIAGKTAFNPASISSARQALNQADIEVQKIVSDTNKAREAQAKHTSEIVKGKTELNDMSSILGRLAASAATAFSVKQIISVADSYTSTAARLNMINDGLQSQKELQDMIFASAERSRTTYGAIAPVISKLGVLAGDAFDSNKEMVYFAELMNKNFVIGGASAQEQSAAMYQLTQAMAAGRLQGDEFRSILENAPLLAKAISKEMGVPIGQLRDLSREGLITADIIKAALLNSAEEIEAEYSKVPHTWSQVWSMVVNDAYQNFAPLIEWIGSGAQFVYEHWSTIEPVFYGVAGALGVYTLAMGAAGIATGIVHLQTLLLNKALFASPIGWVCLGVGVAIGLFMTWANKIGGVDIAWQTFWYNFQRISTNVVMKVRSTFTEVDILMQNTLNTWINNLNIILDKLNFSFRFDEFTFANKSISENVVANAKDLANLREKKENLDILKAKKMEQEKDTSNKNTEVSAIKNYSAETANNTSNIKDSLKASVDELKLLREVANRQAIAKYTTKEVKIDMSGMAINLQNEADYDGFVGKLSRDLQEAMAITGEGLHV